MKQISIALLLCLCTLAGFAQNGKALDLKEIVSGKFTPKNISGVIPIPGDGEHYSQMNADRTQIIKYSFKTGKPVEVLFDAATSRECTFKTFDSYSFAPDGSKLLIATETTPIYRHSYTAVHYIYSLKRNLDGKINNITAHIPYAPTPDFKTDRHPATVPTASVIAPPTTGTEFDRKNFAVRAVSESAEEFTAPVMQSSEEKTVIAMPRAQRTARLTAATSPDSLKSCEKADATERATYIPETGAATVDARAETASAAPKVSAFTDAENAAFPRLRSIPQNTGIKAAMNALHTFIISTADAIAEQKGTAAAEQIQTAAAKSAVSETDVFPKAEKAEQITMAKKTTAREETGDVKEFFILSQISLKIFSAERPSEFMFFGSAPIFSRAFTVSSSRFPPISSTPAAS